MLRPALGPLHPVTLGDALAVHRGFHQAGRNAFAATISLAVVNQACSIAADLDGKLMGGTDELAEMRVI